MAAHMDKIEAFGPEVRGVPHLLREMSFDESAKALATIEKRHGVLTLPEIEKRVGRIRP